MLNKKSKVGLLEISMLRIVLAVTKQKKIHQHFGLNNFNLVAFVF
jgi:hypothetical protein